MDINRMYLVYKGLIIPNLSLFNKINWISMKQVFSENMLSDFSDKRNSKRNEEMQFLRSVQLEKEKILSQNVKA